MTDAPTTAAAAPARATTAGGLLRQARQARGLHIAALAAAIKVVPRKLELLESDRFEQLLDATFTRALAQAVCRTLRVDATPILALLPPPNGHRLEQVAAGLNTPFRERPGRLVPKQWASVASPALWFAAVLLIAAVVVYVMSAGWLSFPKSAVTRTSAADVAVAAAQAIRSIARTALQPAASMEPTASTTQSPESPVSAEAEAVAAASTAGVLQLRATSQSWIEVTDARGQALLARLLQPGENVGLDGVTPLMVRIGNAGGTQVMFRGESLELASFTRDNIARLELK